MIESEVSFTSLYTKELESVKINEKIFKLKKDVYLFLNRFMKKK